MILLPTDSARFFRLYWALNAYVNRRLAIIPSQFTADSFRKIPFEQLVEVRDAFVAHPELLDRYLEEDPDQLGTEDRALVSGWRLKVAGDFLVVRHLKKFTVFLDERAPGHLYGVVGLQSSIQEMISQSPPVLVNAVLLPFQGVIVTDGLVRSTAVHFGRNICANINQAYSRIRSREGIVERLDSTERSGPDRQNRKPARDWSSEVDAIAARADRMREASEPQHRAALNLLRASAGLAQAVFHAPDERRVRLRSLRRAVSQIEQLLQAEELGL